MAISLLCGFCAMRLCKRNIFGKSLEEIPKQLSCYSLGAFMATFIVLGISLSVSGPSVIFLEEISYTWEDEVALIFTARSVGALGGWLFSIAILENNPKDGSGLFGIGLIGLICVHFVVAFSRHLWWLLAAFAIQGTLLVIVTQGCLAFVHAKCTSPKFFHQILLFCGLLGYALTPMMLIPLAGQSTLVLTPVTEVNTSSGGMTVFQALVRPPRDLSEELSNNANVSFNISTEIIPTTIMISTIPEETAQTNIPVSTATIVQESELPTESKTALSTVLMESNTFVSSTTVIATSTLVTENLPQDPLTGENSTEITPSSTFEDMAESAVASEDLMKPSFVDAEHLNPDSESAGGANLAEIMKQAGAGVQLSEPEDSEVLKEPKDEENMKPSVVDATHLSQDSNTADGSDTAAKMKQVDENLHESELPPIMVPHVDSNITNATDLDSQTSIASTLPPSLNVSHTPNQKSPKPEIEPPKKRDKDTYTLVSTFNAKENNGGPRAWNHERMRGQYKKSIQRVYLAVGFLTLFVWFILLPLTGIFRHVKMVLECGHNRGNEPHTPTPTHVAAPVEPEIPNCIQSAEEVSRDVILRQNQRQVPLPKPQVKIDVPEQGEDENTVNSARTTTATTGQTKNVTWNSNIEQNIGRETMIRGSISVPNFAVLRSARHYRRDPSFVGDGCQKEQDYDLAEQAVFLSYAPEPTVWPMIEWPEEFWIFFATFLFAGLETTYGAFLHSFALKTLHWSPYDSLVVTTIFWAGNGLGRLCCLCLGPSADLGVSILQNAVHQPALRPAPTSYAAVNTRRRRDRIFNIAALFIRTAGSIICLVSASMLKHFTKPRLIYPHSGSDFMDTMNIFKNRATWMGSFGIGLGLGITAGSGLNVYNPLGRKFYLACLLGQLVVPATAGYLTERMLHRNASETLGRTSFILSFLMFFCLTVDLALRLMRRFRKWNDLTEKLSCFPSKKFSKTPTKRTVRDVDEDCVQSPGDAAPPTNAIPLEPKNTSQ